MPPPSPPPPSPPPSPPSFPPPSPPPAPPPDGDVEALVEIYTRLGGDSWARNKNWGVGHPCENEWEGVACCPITKPFCLDERRRRLVEEGTPGATLTSDPSCKASGGMCLIANIDLSSNGMAGSLASDGTPSPFAGGALRWVQELDFSNNSLLGIPLESLTAMPRLQTLLAANNRFDYENTPYEVLRACSAPFGLQCTGMPQESCSAFDGPYRVALEEVAACVRCDSFIAAVFAMLMLISVYVVVVGLYSLIVIAYPAMLENNLATISILFTFWDVFKIVKELRIEWPDMLKRTLSTVTLSITIFDSARPECLFTFTSEDHTYYYYNMAKVCLPMCQIIAVWLVRCIIAPAARRRRRHWVELARTLERVHVEELLEPLGAAGIRSLDALRKQHTIQQLIATLHALKGSTRLANSSFRNLTVAHIEALIQLGLVDENDIPQHSPKMRGSTRNLLSASSRNLLKQAAAPSASAGSTDDASGCSSNGGEGAPPAPPSAKKPVRRQDTFAVDMLASRAALSKERAPREHGSTTVSAAASATMHEGLMATVELDALKQALAQIRPTPPRDGPGDAPVRRLVGDALPRNERNGRNGDALPRQLEGILEDSDDDDEASVGDDEQPDAPASVVIDIEQLSVHHADPIAPPPPVEVPLSPAAPAVDPSIDPRSAAGRLAAIKARKAAGGGARPTRRRSDDDDMEMGLSPPASPPEPDDTQPDDAGVSVDGGDETAPDDGTTPSSSCSASQRMAHAPTAEDVPTGQEGTGQEGTRQEGTGQEGTGQEGTGQEHDGATASAMTEDVTANSDLESDAVEHEDELMARHLRQAEARVGKIADAVKLNLPTPPPPPPMLSLSAAPKTEEHHRPTAPGGKAATKGAPLSENLPTPRTAEMLAPSVVPQTNRATATKPTPAPTLSLPLGAPSAASAVSTALADSRIEEIDLEGAAPAPTALVVSTPAASEPAAGNKPVSESVLPWLLSLYFGPPECTISISESQPRDEDNSSGSSWRTPITKLRRAVPNAWDTLIKQPEQLEQVEVVMFERMLVESWGAAAALIMSMSSSEEGTYLHQLSNTAGVIAIGVLSVQALLALHYLRTHSRLVALSQRVVRNVKARMDEPLRELLRSGDIRLLRCAWLASNAADDKLGRDAHGHVILMPMQRLLEDAPEVGA